MIMALTSMDKASYIFGKVGVTEYWASSYVSFLRCTPFCTKSFE